MLNMLLFSSALQNAFLESSGTTFTEVKSFFEGRFDVIWDQNYWLSDSFFFIIVCNIYKVPSIESGICPGHLLRRPVGKLSNEMFFMGFLKTSLVISVTNC